MTRPVKVNHAPSNSSRTNRNGPFHWMYQPKFPEFWVEWKAPNELLEMRFEFTFTRLALLAMHGFLNFSIMAHSQSW